MAWIIKSFNVINSIPVNALAANFVSIFIQARFWLYGFNFIIPLDITGDWYYGWDLLVNCYLIYLQVCHQILVLQRYSVFSWNQVQGVHYVEHYVLLLGETLYGNIMKPTTLQPGEKCPTILNVYGGPHIQVRYGLKFKPHVKTNAFFSV